MMNNAVKSLKAILSDEDAQIPLRALLLFVGIIMVLIGLVTATTNLGLGLMWMGAGFVLGGFGGYAVFKHPVLAISGSGGFVLILVGAFISSL